MFAVFTFKIEVSIVLKLIQKNHVSVKSKHESAYPTHALSPLAKKQHHVTSKGLHKLFSVCRLAFKSTKKLHQKSNMAPFLIFLRWWWGEG